MKFTTIVALIGSAVAIKTDSLAAANINMKYEKCRYKVEGDVCVKLNDNLQPFNCEENPAPLVAFQHTNGKCTW